LAVALDDLAKGLKALSEFFEEMRSASGYVSKVQETRLSCAFWPPMEPVQIFNHVHSEIELSIQSAGIVEGRIDTLASRRFPLRLLSGLAISFLVRLCTRRFSYYVTKPSRIPNGADCDIFGYSTLDGNELVSWISRAAIVFRWRVPSKPGASNPDDDCGE